MEQHIVLEAQYHCPPFGVLSPSSEEDIEEVLRHPIRTPSSVGARHRYPRAPIRRRIHSRDEGCAKTYQMFEISTSLDSRRSMDGSDISSASALTMATSAGSTSTDPWSLSGFVEQDEERDGADFDWDEEEGLLLVPKLEPMEDDVVDMDMSDYPRLSIQESVVPETPSNTTPTLVKRPRGRPRKHPKPTAESLSKVAKGRSKTGCITCRKRKKKCDETKPGCKWRRDLSPSHC